MRYSWLAVLVLGCNSGGKSDDVAGTTDTDPSAADTDAAGDTDPGTDTDLSDTDTTDTDDVPVLPAVGTYATDLAVSGTRLQRVAVEDVHGNVALAWFHDTELDVPCSVRKASDGALRCLPEATPFGGAVVAGAWYGDSGCTTTVAVVADACGNSGYFTDAGDPESLYTFVGYYPTAYQWNGRACVATAVPAGTSSVGLTAVDPTGFVAFTRAGEAVDAEVGVHVLEGADGSRVAVGLWSVDEAQPATFTQGLAVPYRDTVPTDTKVRTSCSGAYNAYLGRDDGYVPAWVLETTYFEPFPGGGGGGPVYLEELHEVTGESATYCDGGSLVAPPTGTKVYVVGSTTADWTDFPAVQVVTDSGSGQRFRHLATAAGTPIAPVPASGAVEVRVDGVSHGVGRWQDRAALLPTSFGETNYYGDFRCDQPVESPFSGLASGDLVLRRQGSADYQCRRLPGAPDLFDGIWTVPAATTGSLRTIYVSSPGQCYEAGTDVFYPLTDVSASAATRLPEPALASP